MYIYARKIDDIFQFLALCRIGLEYAFPQWAAAKLSSEETIAENQQVLEMLRNGSLGLRLPTEKVLTLTSGSQAEGLAMEKGYTSSDLDEMRMYGRSLQFTVPGEADLGVVGSVLVMRTEGCPPGFCRIEAVGDLDENIRRIAGTVPWNEQKAIEQVGGCFETAHGRHWLLSGRIHRALLPRMSEDTIDKPTWGNDLMEMAATFIGSAPLPSVRNFLNRRRDGDWPRQRTLDLIGQLPALIVCKPHSSNPSQTFRCSWSHIEILLSEDMPDWVKQAYRAFKYIVKGRLDLSRLIDAAEKTARGRNFLNSLENVTPLNISANVQDNLKRMLDQEDPQADGAPEHGETRFSSFFLKTVLLHCLEESASVGEQGDPFSFLLVLSIKLRKTLKAGYLSNYFLPDFNLFENLHAGDRAVVLDAVSDIWLDPIMTVVRSLRYPGQLYDGGDDLHGKLVDVMKTNLDHERTAADRNSLMVLLQRLDEACRVVAEPSLVSLMPWPLYEKVWLISSILARFLAIIWKVIL